MFERDVLTLRLAFMVSSDEIEVLGTERQRRCRFSRQTPDRGRDYAAGGEGD